MRSGEAGRTEVVAGLRTFLVNRFGEEFTSLPESCLLEDVGLDSLARAELVSLIEDEYGLDFGGSEGALAAATSLGSLASLVVSAGRL